MRRRGDQDGPDGPRLLFLAEIFTRLEKARLAEVEAHQALSASTDGTF